MSICKGKSALKFKCINSHVFYLETEKVGFNRRDWCSKCDKYIELLEEQLNEQNIKIEGNKNKKEVDCVCD